MFHLRGKGRTPIQTTKKMIKTEDIKKIVKLTLTTGLIINIKTPLSLLLIGKSGIGKTEVTKNYYGKTILIMTDVSYFGLLDEIKDNRGLQHLIIMDFLKVTRKKRSTTDNLIGVLCSFMEEGVRIIHLYKKKYDFKGKKLGIITSTTKASLSQNRYDWESRGFLQRFMICSYSYTDQTIEDIMSFIHKEGEEDNKEKISGKRKIITSTPELNAQFRIISGDSFRLQKQLMMLAKGNAYLRGDNKVKQEDINEIIRLSKYFNFDFIQI